MPTRREFLQVGGAVAGGVALAAMTGGPQAMSAEQLAASKKSGYIDAHVHVWTPDTKRYPLAEGFKPEGMKPPSFTPEELMAHAAPCGVDRVVLIQMSFYRFDNSYMLDTIRRFPGVYSGVAIVDLDSARPQDTMRELARQGVRGFRIHPPAGASLDGWIGSSGMQTMWRTAADENLAVCPLINPEALPLIDRMCEKFPQTKVVVDHFARIGIDGGVRSLDLSALCRLARHQRTHVKTSAFYALGKKQAPYTDLGPMIERLLESFGRERLMWATDCPFQVQGGHTYRDSVDLIAKRLETLSADDRDWLLRKTAERVYFTA